MVVSEPSTPKEDKDCYEFKDEGRNGGLRLSVGRKTRINSMMRHSSSDGKVAVSGKAEDDVLLYLDKETVRGRVRRRHRLSGLKKIILMENEAKWTELMGRPPPYGDILLHKQHEEFMQRESEEKSASPELNIVRLDGLVNTDDVHDEDEYKETVQNIRDLSEQYGTVHQVLIPFHRDSSNSPMSCCCSPQVLAVFVSFSSSPEAEKAKDGLDKIIIGGQAISASLVGDLGEEYNNEHDLPNVATILVKGALFLDKNGHMATPCNIREICESFGSVLHVYNPPTLPKTRKSMQCLDVIVEYCCAQDAKAAEVGLQGRLVGEGRALSSAWVHGVWVGGSVKEGVSLSVEDYARVRDDLESIFTAFSSSVIWCMTDLQYPKGTVSLCNLAKLWFLDASDSASAIKLLSGRMTCGGDVTLVTGGIFSISSSACSACDYDAPGLHAKATEEECDALRSAAMSYAANKSIHERQANIQERYATGVSVPRVSRVLPPSSNAAVISPPSCDEELNSLIKSLLMKLMKFQERARILDPSKARGSRRRIVFGLKETERGLRLGNVKMVILARDIDACGVPGGLDDKVAQIIKLTEEHDVPIIYGLNKKSIGRALKKNIKVSVVGIYHFNGAEEEKSSILQLLVSRQGPHHTTTNHQ